MYTKLEIAKIKRHQKNLFKVIKKKTKLVIFLKMSNKIFIKEPNLANFLKKPPYKWKVRTDQTPFLSVGIKLDPFIIIFFF